MKKIIIIFTILCLYGSVKAQRKCGSELNMIELKNTNIEKYNRIINSEENSQRNIHKSTFKSNSKIIIPVVVHIVYNNSIQNISDEQILSQIKVLNEDFNRTNSDRINTPESFRNIAGNANLEFKLAKLNPNGYITNGITRTYTQKSYFSHSLNDVKFSNTGGHNAWNTEQYLNIWVCNLSNGLLGYAQFPFELETSPNTDGVVINYECFGRGGSAVSPFNKGRTATHEVGHWLNLRHIWGDDDNANGNCVSNECSGTDYVDDTPNQGERNYNCPTFPKKDCCSVTSDGVMFMNYMDYVDDGCMNMFTLGQIKRMRYLFDEQSGIRHKMTKKSQMIVNGIDITGPDLICDQASYTIENLPTNTPVQWSTNNSNLTLVSGQGTATAVFHKNGNGECTVKASIANGAMNLEKEVSTRIIVRIEGPNLVKCNSGGSWIAKSDCELPSGTVYQWNLRGSNHSYSGSDFIFGILSNCSSYNYKEPITRQPINAIHDFYELELTVKSSDGLIYAQESQRVEVFGSISLVPSLFRLRSPGHQFFTPNNDGINDELKLSNLSSEKLVIENHIVIYNSQGLVVYEGYGDENFRGFGNVGSYAGIALPEGVYFYKTMGRCTTSGSIYLRR